MHHFGRVALLRGKNFAWGVFALFLAPGFPRFPSASGMTVSSPTSIFEESCLSLIDCVKPLPFLLGGRSLLGQVTCSCLFRAFVTCSSSASSLFFSVFASLLVRFVVC